MTRDRQDGCDRHFNGLSAAYYCDAVATRVVGNLAGRGASLFVEVWM